MAGASRTPCDWAARKRSSARSSRRLRRVVAPRSTPHLRWARTSTRVWALASSPTEITTLVNRGRIKPRTWASMTPEPSFRSTILQPLGNLSPRVTSASQTVPKGIAYVRPVRASRLEDQPRIRRSRDSQDSPASDGPSRQTTAPPPRRSRSESCRTQSVTVNGARELLPGYARSLSSQIGPPDHKRPKSDIERDDCHR